MRAFAFLLILTISSGGKGEPARARAQADLEPFTIVIAAERAEVPLGQPVELSVELKNTSASDMNGTSSYNRGILIGYHYHVRRIDGGATRQLQAHYPTPLVGSDITGTLKPGESGGGKSDLSELFDLTAGKYSVQLSRDVRDASGHPTGGVVKSNTITITIVPPPFTITISTPGAEVEAGSPVPLDIRLANNSDEELKFGAPPAPPGLDRHFAFWCRWDQKKEVARPLLLTQDFQPFIALKPGETYDERVSLGSACDLTQPGEYRVKVSRYDPRGASNGAVTSNEITLTVKP